MGDNNSNNSDGMQLLKTLLTADVPSEGSVMQSIRNKVNSLLNNKQQISILQELQQANLDNEFKEMTDNTLMGLNAIYFSSVVLTQFMFTRKVSKVVFLLSCAYFNFYLIQPIEIEYKLRKLALQNTLAGQEVRNLYRFYFQDHEFIKEMTQKSANCIHKLMRLKNKFIPGNYDVDCSFVIVSQLNHPICLKPKQLIKHFLLIYNSQNLHITCE